MPWGPLQVEIVGRKNLGTNSRPVRGYLLAREDRKGAFDGDAVLTNFQGGYRTRRKPEWGDWVELIPLDGQGPPLTDLFDTVGEERD